MRLIMHCAYYTSPVILTIRSTVSPQTAQTERGPFTSTRDPLRPGCYPGQGKPSRARDPLQPACCPSQGEPSRAMDAARWELPEN